MNTVLLLAELWNAGQDSPANRTFDTAHIGASPEPSRSYLEHAIAAGTSLASAVRLHMHGEIKLKGWYPFSAEQVIRWGRGMI